MTKLTLIRTRNRPEYPTCIYPESSSRPSQGDFPKVFLKRSWSGYLRRFHSVLEACPSPTLTCTLKYESYNVSRQWLLQTLIWRN